MSIILIANTALLLAGLKVSVIGLGGVFAVLILFFIVVKIMVRMSRRPQDAEAEAEASKE